MVEGLESVWGDLHEGRVNQEAFPAGPRTLSRFPVLVCILIALQLLNCVCVVAWPAGRESPVTETILILAHHKEFREARVFSRAGPGSMGGVQHCGVSQHMLSDWIKSPTGMQILTSP